LGGDFLWTAKRSKFPLNFAGEAVGTVGLCYFFDKTGHYKFGARVSMVNFGASSFAVSYSSSHR